MWIWGGNLHPFGKPAALTQFILDGYDWGNVIETQHYLSSERHISIDISNELALFEFDTHSDIFSRDLKKKAAKLAELEK